jgi:hypothetical protein
MARCAGILFLWFVGIFLLGSFVAPGLSRISYPQPLDLLVLAFIPVGAFHAAKYEAPKLLFLLYGCLASSVFVLHFTVLQGKIGLRLVSFPYEDIRLTLIACVVMLGFGFTSRWAVDVRKKWTNWLRYPKGHCQGCGYNLTGNVSGICPECGKQIDRQQ